MASPTPICHPNPPPYTQLRNWSSQASFTWRVWDGSRKPPSFRSEAIETAASTADSPSASVADRSSAPAPSASSAVPSPRVAPPSTAPSTNHVAVE